MLYRLRTASALLAFAIFSGACGQFRDQAAPAQKEAKPELRPESPLPSIAETPRPVAPAVGSSAAMPGVAPPNGAPLSFAPIVKQVNPSVVTITTVGEEVERSAWGFRPRVRESRGLGTGFIVQKDGVVVTNNHVIADAEQITVQLSDGRNLPARILGRDPQTDVAVIKIETKELTPVALGDSDAIDVGDWVVAIGNPFGLSHTVSAGILSAKGRTKDDVELDPTGYYDFLQTDASINPGNSGGPLLNLRGEVVGINSAIRGGGAQGIGFAIPINLVKHLLPMLIRDGHVTRSALGVSVIDFSHISLENRIDLKIVDEHESPLIKGGAVLGLIVPGGPADKAGLKVRDVVVAFEGQPVERSAQFQWLASAAGVGKTVTVSVIRDGKPLDVKVVLGSHDALTNRRERPRR